MFGDAGHGVGQFPVPQRPVEERLHQQQGPAVADPSQGPIEGAVAMAHCARAELVLE
jgi:hypothetical protein